MKKVFGTFIVTILLSYMIISVVAFINIKSPICDEVAHHVASGYSYVKTGDYRMNPSSPALIRSLIGFPLLFINLSLPVDHVSWQTNDSPVFGQLFLYKYNSNADEIIFLSRIPVLILSCLLAFLIYAWAREIYGAKAGIFALFLYVFSPDVLGNSGVAMTDIGGSFFMFLSGFTFWHFIKGKSTSRLILSGIAFGLAQASKHSAIILVPILILVTIVDIFISKERSYKNAILAGIKNLVLIFVIGIIALWATYSFEFKPLLKNAPDVAEKVDYIRAFVSKIPIANQATVQDWAVYCAKNVPIPLSSFTVSFLGVVNQVQVGGQPLFLMGQQYVGGVKWYYPYLFLIKMPLSFIILIIFSIALVLFRKRTPIDLVTNFLIIFTIYILFFAISMSKLQGGIRYLLPVFPFLFMWTADSINVKFRSNAGRFFKVCFFSIIIIWYASTSIHIRPHYLAYFNELVGGPDEKVYTISHDMDWGQDLKLLGEYMRQVDIGEVSLLYFGTADPEYYEIVSREITPEEREKPKNRVYAISVRYLNGVKWAKEQEPTQKMGYSIFLYDLRDSD